MLGSFCLAVAPLAAVSPRPGLVQEGERGSEEDGWGAGVLEIDPGREEPPMSGPPGTGPAGA